MNEEKTQQAKDRDIIAYCLSIGGIAVQPQLGGDCGISPRLTCVGKQFRTDAEEKYEKAQPAYQVSAQAIWNELIRERLH